LRTYFAWTLVTTFAALAIACSGDKPSPTPTSTSAATSAPAPTATTAPSATPVPTLPPPAPLEWHDCDSWQCADFTVPLDYSNPGRGDLTLSLTRLPATDPGQRIGSLLLNPGGPGGSAVDYLKAVAFAIPAEIKQRFDLVAFDPRGVGASSPILCADNLQQLVALDPDPQTEEAFKAIESAIQAFADLCAQRAGDALGFYGTANVARDMDRIRQALGEDKLNYLGFSYGTSIGQIYADMFPDNFRAMVLDGNVDNSLSPDQRDLEQLLGFEAALDRFEQYCRDTSCFNQDPADAIQTLIDRTRSAPIAAPGEDRSLTLGDLAQGILSSLYARFQRAGLANAIKDALNGDGSRMIRLVDSYWMRRPDGSYPNLYEAYFAVSCLDQAFDRDPQHYREREAEFAAQAPVFGPWFAYSSLPCAYWHADPTPLRTPKAAGAPPILVIGNTGDPATPYKWSVAVSKQLQSAVLLTNDDEGHTAYLQGSNCVADIVNAYLLDLKVPDEGTSCGDAGIEPVPPVQ
jgi:pimeloyl-ACP methyl ester carboxylesterase